VTLKLNALGMRTLRAHPHGLRVTLTVTAGTPGSTLLASKRTVVLYASRQVVDSPAESFGVNSAAPSPALVRSLHSLATDLGPVRQILCTGHAAGAGSLAGDHALALARARAACDILWRVLPSVRYRYTATVPAAPAHPTASSAGPRDSRYIEAAILR
jgi:hypothetical protein